MTDKSNIHSPRRDAATPAISIDADITFLWYRNVAAIPIPALIPRAIPIIYAEGLISLLFGKDLNALFWLLSLNAGTPLDTDVRSQYSMPTDTIFHRARAMADAVREMKLMMHPEITGANNLHTKSIRLIIEFMFVCSSGGWPSDITTTLQMRTQISANVGYLKQQSQELFLFYVPLNESINDNTQAYRMNRYQKTNANVDSGELPERAFTTDPFLALGNPLLSTFFVSTGYSRSLMIVIDQFQKTLVQ
nr:hypothetical protein Iba_chr10fCG3280 [Ipomoea batatas]GME05700.1 hypothetical protein Iba_scaffold3157CG0020 [Ipomoea batatas]